MTSLPRPTLLVAAACRPADALERDLAAARCRVLRARSPAHAGDLAAAGGLDVAVVDQALGGEHGVALLARLRSLDPAVELVLLAGASIGAVLADVTALGALALDCDSATKAVDRLVERARGRFVRRVSAVDMLLPHLPFNRRQRECLERAIRYQIQKLIADELGITPKTVRTHIEGAYDRLGVHSIDEVRTLVRANTALVLGEEHADAFVR